MSTEISEIAKALVKAQSEMSNPTKGSNNPFFKSRYADLNSVREAILPVLNKYGISVLQVMHPENGKNYIKTILLHESGQSIESLTEIIYAKQNDAQAQGSGITYARRYGLQAICCVGAEDDDGNAAIQPQQNKQAKQPQPQTPLQKPILERGTEKWEGAIKALKEGKTDVIKIAKVYDLTDEIYHELAQIKCTTK